MTARLERAFAARAAELPARVIDLVLLAAINDSDSVAEILAAAELLSGTVRALRRFPANRASHAAAQGSGGRSGRGNGCGA